MAAAIITLSLLSIACPGGGKSAGSSGRTNKESLVVITGGSPAHLDPTLTNDSASSEIMKQIYDTLFNQDFDTMSAIPSLAERYAFENDANGQPTRLRLFLKQGVKFHNGEELKASDVKFSLDRAKASPTIGHIAGSLDTIEVINDYEVLVTLRFPFAPILNNLAHTAMSIVNEKAVIAGGETYTRNPVGTGPFKFVNWVAGNRIELTRWDQYHGNPVKIKDVTIRYITDPATALLELETGGADIYFQLLNSPPDIERVANNPDLTVLRRPGLSLNYIGFNFRKPPFNDVRVRQAISHAVDRQAILREVWKNIGSPGQGPLAQTVWASAAGQLNPQYDYNPEKARQLLAEAGYPNGFSTKLSTNDTAIRIDINTAIASMLRQVGIDAQVEIVEWASYLEMTNRGEHDMYTLGWVTITGDPDYGLEIFHSRAHGSPGNRSFYTNPEVDRLLDAARVETNPDRRYQMYIDAQKIIHEDTVWIYLQEGEYVVGTRSDVRGFNINPAGHHPLWTVYFE